MRRRYVTADVFTDRRFGGNPLAVVLDAADLSGEQMQAIASEFNYSETTFVLAPRDPRHTARVRIFTPRAELPFAGHPNVGTAFVLARHDAARVGAALVFEEAAGLVPVALVIEDGMVIGAELTAPEPLSLRDIVASNEVAAALSLTTAEVLTTRHEPRIISVGLPFLVAELASRDALRRAKPDLVAISKILPRDGANAIYFYTREIAPDDMACEVAARMFAPFDGIVEDPATGSATAALAAWMATLHPKSDLDFTVRVAQGVDMGRPSVLVARVRKKAGALEAIKISGHCVEVMQGTIAT